MIASRQRKQITLDGIRYRLTVPFRSWTGTVGETRSEGPFYESVPKDPGFVYMPDVGYLEGTLVTKDDKRPKPLFMHALRRK